MIPPLSDEQFRPIVRGAPLISIDLVIKDGRGALLVGKRSNGPARGIEFVPGGCIRKDERIADAFVRILREETSLDAMIEDTRFIGVFEQFYPDNRFGEPGFGTHYVTMAHQLDFDHRPSVIADDQHSSFRWVERFTDDTHPYLKPYF